MTENIDLEEKERKINELIESILCIERKKREENKDESIEIKLGRRLEQRSYDKLSEEILEHLITRYEIDNNDLPSKNELIKMMFNFLGNIQKAPENYNLINDETRLSKVNLQNKIGTGFHARVYSFKIKNSCTKKKKKYLAFKEQNIGIPYTIDIHITSAILLALYGFQPKYYNQFFMEIGQYGSKSNQRKFYNLKAEGRNIVEKNIKFYILFNFTNISDQIRNSMIREINDELIKIDIRRLNSEKLHQNIEKYLDFFSIYNDIFFKYKKEVKNELNKLLIIDEEFLIDLIKFRTERGCFDIPRKELAIQIDCITSSYKVIKISKDDNTFFSEILKQCKKNYRNLHNEANPAFSWMLYMLLQYKVLNQQEYNDYVNKFNSKSETFEKLASKIRKGETLIFNNKREKIYKTINKKIRQNKIIENEESNLKLKENNKNEKLLENNIKEKEKEREKEREKEKERETAKEKEIEKEKENNINIFNKKNNKHQKENIEINKKSNNNIKNNMISTNEKEKNVVVNNEIIETDNNKKNDSLSYDKVIEKEDGNNILKTDNIKNIIKRNNDDKIGQESKIEQNRIEQNDKKKKKSGWFCCGKDSVDVID